MGLVLVAIFVSALFISGFLANHVIKRVKSDKRP